MNEKIDHLLNQSKKYIFIEQYKCNMCLSSGNQLKLLGRRLDKAHGFSPKKKTGIVNSISKCTNCGLVFSNPMPIPENIQDHYNMDPLEYWPERYFKYNPLEFKVQIEHLKKIKGIKKGDKYLDIGAGLGKVMIALENQGMDVYGIEPSKAFYQVAINKMNISKEKLRLCNIEEASFDKNFFDFISFGAVLEHLYWPGESILKALNWLKPGGVIHIEIPNSEYLLTKCINLFNKLRFNDYISHLSPMHPPYHLYEFSLKTFEIHSQQNGYRLLDHTIDVCTTPGPLVLKTLLDPIMKFTNTGMQLTVWLQKK